MGNFSRDNRRDNRSGGGRSFGRPDFRNRDSERPMMHKTVCSKCGKDCEVPFKPTGSKPVFCRECFRNNNNEGFDSRRPEPRNFDRPRFENRDNRNDTRSNTPEQPRYAEQFEKLSAKLDKILNILTSVIPAEETQVTPEVEIPEEQPVETVKKAKVPKKSPSPKKVKPQE